MRTRKQKIILTFAIICVIFVLALIGLYTFRDTLLQKAIVRVSNKMDREYDSHFSIKSAKFNGLTGVEMKDVILAPKNADTLFRIESIKTSVNFWHLFTGDIQLGSLDARNGFVQLVRNANGSNFDAFLPKKTDEKTDEKSNYAQRAYKLLNTALNLVPTDMKLENLSLRMDDMGKKAQLNLKP